MSQAGSDGTALSAAARREEIPLYQEIADNARLATGARYVHFSWFDPSDRSVHVGGMSSIATAYLQRGLDIIQRVFPSWTPDDVAFPADVNPCTAAVFLERKIIHVPLDDVVAGTVHPWIAQIARTVIGMRWCFSCPVEVDGEVLGSLALHGPEPFPETQQQACLGFARQAALTLENARLIRTLEDQQADVRRSRRLIADAEDRQRQEVAALLTSHIQSQLLVVYHELGTALQRWPDAPAEARAVVTRARGELIRIGEREMARAGELLHPARVMLGLGPAIHALAERFAGTLDVRVTTSDAFQQVDGPLDSTIPEPVRLSAYRIVEEGLRNVAQHANFAAAEVMLDVAAANGTPTLLTATVIDRGAGFDPSSTPDGLGLRIVESRAEQVGGTWGVESAPDGGTRLWCKLPLASAGSAR